MIQLVFMRLAIKWWIRIFICIIVAVGVLTVVDHAKNAEEPELKKENKEYVWPETLKIEWYCFDKEKKKCVRVNAMK